MHIGPLFWGFKQTLLSRTDNCLLQIKVTGPNIYQSNNHCCSKEPLKENEDSRFNLRNAFQSRKVPCNIMQRILVHVTLSEINN